MIRLIFENAIIDYDFITFFQFKTINEITLFFKLKCVFYRKRIDLFTKTTNIILLFKKYISLPFLIVGYPTVTLTVQLILQMQRERSK